MENDQIYALRFTRLLKFSCGLADFPELDEDEEENEIEDHCNHITDREEINVKKIKPRGIIIISHIVSYKNAFI